MALAGGAIEPFLHTDSMGSLENTQSDGQTSTHLTLAACTLLISVVL